MISALVLCLMTGLGHAGVLGFEPWVEHARAKLSATFPDFMMDRSTEDLDQGLLDEVQRLDALIADPIAKLNFRNLLTKLYVVRSAEHLTMYRARLGSSPSVAYPYYHAIEVSPAAAWSAAGRVFLIEAIHLGFDRVTGFGAKKVPGTSWTGTLETRSRRAGIDFLARYLTHERRRELMAQIIARGERGVRDQYVKFYHRLAAADGESPAPVYAEVMTEPYRARIACEMGLWRRYDPVRDRDRLIGR